MDTRINETLARLRSKSGLTQEEAANHLGITKAAVSKWECGQSMPDISLLPAIADLYSTSIDDLFGRVQEPDKESIKAAYQTALALLGEACAAMSNPVDPGIFDKIEDMLWDDADDEVICARSEGVAELRAAYVSALENDRLWDSLRDDVRFCRVITRISDSSEAR